MNYTPVIRAHSTDRRARFALPIDADATVTIGLPGVKITARLDDSERRIARELVIRLADRRVLNLDTPPGFVGEQSVVIGAV